MEKRKPQYDLNTIQATFCEARVLQMTGEARRCARALGMTLDDVVTCIQGMRRAQFYKSMTSLASHTVWQDVYHVPFCGFDLYVKFTVDSQGYLVISFKER